MMELDILLHYDMALLIYDGSHGTNFGIPVVVTYLLQYHDNTWKMGSSSTPILYPTVSNILLFNNIL